jgi:hypothetical protein
MLLLNGISSHVLLFCLRLIALRVSLTCQNAAGTGMYAAPLLEEKRDLGSQELILNGNDFPSYRRNAKL